MGSRAPLRYRYVRLAVLVAVAVAAGACATVPSGGPVVSEKIAPAGGPQAGVYEQLIAPPPQPGWAPDNIVSGFLYAGADFTGDHKVAAEYLTPAAQRSWHPGSKATVFSSEPQAELVSASGSDATVRVSGRQVATIGSQGEGEYVAAAHGGVSFQTTFHLHKVRGQWRIADPGGQLLLTSNDVARAYRSQDLYFLDSTMTALVPDPVFVPVGYPVLQSVTSLLRGATGWLSQATRTAFPRGTRLISVDEADDVVRVNLGGAAVGTTEHQQELMSAQLVWTLRTFPDAAQNLNLVLELNGQPVKLPSIGSAQQPVATSWQNYDPSGAGSSFPAFFVGNANKVQMLNSVGSGSQAATPVPGEAGTGDVALNQIAVSPDTSRIAGVSPGDDAVYTGGLTPKGALALQLSGKNFSNPSWDRDGNAWVAGTSGGKTGVWMLASGAHPVPVRMTPGTSGYGPVQALRVARDGARIALITGTGSGQQLLVGAIVRNSGQVAIGPVVPIGTGLSQMAQLTDLAWSDADNLVVLAQPSGGEEQLFKVPVDGGQYQALGTAPAGTQSVAAAPGRPVLAGVPGSGDVQYSPDELSWRNLDPGQYPAYPG